MREHLKRLGAESFVYGLGQVGGRAVQLLLVPILTRVLAKEAFGISELVAGYSQTAARVLVMGMDGALARHFYEQPDAEARVRMVSSSFVFRLVTSFSIAALLVAFSGMLSEPLMSGPGYRKYLAIGAMTLPFTLFVMFGNDVLRVTFQPWKYIGLNMLQTVVTTGVSLWLVLARHSGVVGVLYGRLVGDAIAAAVGIVLVRHYLRPRFSRTTLRRMLAYGVPAVPAIFAFGFLAGLDRYVMQRTRTLDELAVYAVALKFFSVVTIAASAFQLAYGPFAYARARTPEAPRLYARVFSAYMALASLGALLIASFVPEALRLLAPPSYAGAAAPALWLAFAAVVFGAYTVVAIGIGLALRTPLLGWCAGGALAVGALAHATLTPRFGGPGAGIATFLGYSTAAFLTYRVAQRVHPLPFRGGRAVALLALAIALACAVQAWAPGGIAGVAVKLGVAAAFAALCIGLKMHRDRGAIAPSWNAVAAAETSEA